MKSEKILINVSGPDHPGITSKLMEVVARASIPIIDMGQAVTHGLLSLSFVIIMPEQKDERDSIIKDLLFEADRLKQTLTYKILHQEGVYTPGESYILNCVSTQNISAGFLGRVSFILANNNLNITRIDKVSPLNFRSLEITVSVPKDVQVAPLKSQLLGISNEFSVDIAFLRDNVFRRSKRIIAFDMDSTLIQTEVIDELADLHGVGENIRKITERAMNGEMDFDHSLKERVGQLKGLKESALQEVAKKLPLTPGVEEFVRTLKGLGYKLAIISGGFSYFANHLKERLNLDYAFANELDIQSGELTGKVKGPIVNAQQKALLLKMIAQQENCQLDQVVAIGDGANDLEMLATAGLGIAYHAKDIVRRQADNHMSHGPMTSILYFLGIPNPEDT